MTAGEIDHPLNLAADRLDDLDPEFIARVREELEAGPRTPERIRAAINALAGLGATVPVAVDAVEQIDGEWFGGGTTAGRYVAFPLHPDQGPPMRAALAGRRTDHGDDSARRLLRRRGGMAGARLT